MRLANRRQDSGRPEGLPTRPAMESARVYWTNACRIHPPDVGRQTLSIACATASKL